MEKYEVLQIADAAIQLQQKSLQQIWYKTKAWKKKKKKKKLQLQIARHSLEEEEEAGALDLLLLLHTGKVQTLKPEFQSL